MVKAVDPYFNTLLKMVAFPEHLPDRVPTKDP